MIFTDERLPMLVLACTLAAPINALTAVHYALLQRHMRWYAMQFIMLGCMVTYTDVEHGDPEVPTARMTDERGEHACSVRRVFGVKSKADVDSVYRGHRRSPERCRNE